VAPLVTSADAARSTTCSGSGGTTSGPCPGNSGTNGNENKCTTTRTGQGGGQGTIKDFTC
jgi:hypothetical protein